MKTFALHRNMTALAIAASALMLAAVPSWAASLDHVEQQKVLRVAVDLNAPPYGMKDAALKEVGSDVESAQLLAGDLGVALEIVPTTQANRIPFLLTDKADVVISSLTITPERQKVVDFTIPYAVIQSVIAAPADVVIKSMDDLAGKTVVTARGTTNDANVTKMAPKSTSIVRYENDATAMTAVTSGRGNIYSGAPAIIASLNKQLEADGKAPLETKIVMATSQLGIGVAKDNQALLDKMNELVRTNLKNGELNTIYKKYHGADLPDEIVN